MTQFDEIKEYEIFMDIYIHEVAARNFYEHTTANVINNISTKKKVKAISSNHALHATDIAEVLKEGFLGIAPYDNIKTTVFDIFFNTSAVDIKSTFSNYYFIELILHEYYQQLVDIIPKAFFKNIAQNKLNNIIQHRNYLRNCLQQYDNLLEIYMYHLPIISVYKQALEHVHTPFIHQQVKKFLIEHREYSDKLLSYILESNIALVEEPKENPLSLINKVISTAHNETIIWNMVKTAEHLITLYLQESISHMRLSAQVKNITNRCIYAAKNRNSIGHNMNLGYHDSQGII